MRKSNPIGNLVEAYGLGVDKQRGRMSFAEAMDSLDALKRDSTQTQDNAYAFAIALAVLTWLHGSQEPDARAELDAWMRAGIEAHVYGSAICDESDKPVSGEELNEWAKVKP